MLVPAAVSAASLSFTAVALMPTTMARIVLTHAGDPDRGTRRPCVAAAGGHRRADGRGGEDRRARRGGLVPRGAAVARALPDQAGAPVRAGERGRGHRPRGR